MLKTEERGTLPVARTAKQIVIIGANGTGKTTYQKKLAAAAKKRGERVLVVTSHIEEWTEYPALAHSKSAVQGFKGGGRLLWMGRDTLDVAAEFRGGLLIFDDCRAYLTATTDPALYRIMISRRQQMVDVCAVGHGFGHIPPAFFTYTTHIVLFRTSDNISCRKNVLNDFEKMREAQARVNAKAIKLPHHYEIVKQ